MHPNVERSLEVLTAVWREMAWGTALLFFAAVVGWVLARHKRFFAVRWMTWWLRRVVLPLISTRSWLSRTLVIFFNNAGILALMVCLAVSRAAAAIAVIAVGLTLGIALRALGQIHLDWSHPGPSAPATLRRQIRLGVLVNLLEPPAIAAAVGLALGRTSLNLPPQDAWQAFVLFVVPLLLVAAGGEAMWIGAGLRLGSAQRPGVVSSGCVAAMVIGAVASGS